MPEQNNDCEVTLVPLLKIAPVHYLALCYTGYRKSTAHASLHSTYSNQEGGERQRREEGGRRETEKRGGREEEESEGWKGLQAVECKRCSFPSLPIFKYSISSACTHLCVAAASSREREGAREALEGADTSSATSDSGPCRLHRGQNCTLHSTVMTVQGCSPGPQLPRTPL